MALEVGSRLAHYDVTALIGEGGMGQVYQATDTKLNRQVALKILPEAFATDPDRLARFQREAQVLASLNHPNIGQIHGIEEADDTRALVLELVEGPTLADRIAKGPIPVDEALPIAKQIAEALEAAHEAGVIHRDLKPANIKVREDGTVKVLDFGLAKALDTSPQGDPSQSPTLTAAATQMGVIMGTAAYMSPEQARGKAVDKRADIWAFGCVVFEMLTGRKAFPGSDVSETLAAVIKSEPEWTLLPSTFARDLLPVVRRCLEKDARLRLRDIGDVRLALNGAFVVERTDAEVGKSWNPSTLFASALAVAFGLTAVWLWVAAEAPSLSSPSEVTRFVLLPPEGSTRIGQFTLSPSGRTVVFAASAQLYRRNLDGLNAEPIPGTDRPFGPFISPDSASIGFFDLEDQMLKRVNLDGAGLQTLPEAPPTARSGAWADDGSIVFNSTGRGGLFTVPATGGDAVNVAEPLGWIDVLPGGQAVLGIDFSDLEDLPAPQYVAVTRLDTGEVEVLFEGRGPRYTAGHLVFWREGDIWGVPFDADQLEVIGEPRRVVLGVQSAVNGSASFRVSRDTLVFRPGGAGRNPMVGMPVWVDRDGTEEPIGIEVGDYSWPRFSPDGTRVALVRVEENEDIWIHDLRMGVSAPLDVHPAVDQTPLWTPDGERVVFRSQRDGPSNLYWRRADRTDDVERLTESDLNQRPLAFTPDGSHLIFENYDDLFDARDLWALPLDTPEAEPMRLTDGDFTESQASVSPDGSLIAYVSEELGYPEVFVRSFPDLASPRLVSTLDIGQQIDAQNADPREGRVPLWSRSGDELFYQSGGAVVAIPVATVGGFTSRAPFVAFTGTGWPWVGEGRHYDVHPDGRFIRIRRDAASQSTNELVVVLNWRSLMETDGAEVR